MLDEAGVQFYRKKLQKTGVALTLSQFEQHLKKLKIKFTHKDVADFVSKEKGSARFARSTRPKQFQTIGVLRPGVYFLDYAEFHKPWAWHNQGMTGFVLAVENVTTFLVNCTNFSMASSQLLVSLVLQGDTNNLLVTFSTANTKPVMP